MRPSSTTRWWSGGATYAWPARSGSPSAGCDVGNLLWRPRMEGRTLGPIGATWRTMRTAAWRSDGSPFITVMRASTPPAEAASAITAGGRSGAEGMRPAYGAVLRSPPVRARGHHAHTSGSGRAGEAGRPLTAVSFYEGTH